MLAVWSTLGLARTLADQLRSRGLLDLAFGVGTLLVLAAVVALALQVRPRGADLGVLAPAVLAVVFAALLGTVDELLQLAVPSRVFDPADVAVNAVAAVLAVTAKVALTGASRRLR